MDRGARGDEIVVTRRGRPSVHLSPLQPRLLADADQGTRHAK
jgi:antitoxin (DNA-binding transcriptional repressor) of toxin-antitoxin stability system